MNQQQYNALFQQTEAMRQAALEMAPIATQLPPEDFRLVQAGIEPVIRTTKALEHMLTILRDHYKLEKVPTT